MLYYRPKAWIITIGNELLIGRVINTNSAWIASKLTFHGAEVERILTVPDRIDDIVEAVREATTRADIVITTGGLGPTADDMTMEAVAAATNRALVLNTEAKRMVKEFYEGKGYVLKPEMIKMAYLPAGAKPIPNPVGAAPGAWLRVGRSNVFVLPGVPREMEAMIDYVLNAIKPILPALCVRERGLIVKGVPEAELAPLLRRAAKLCKGCYTKSHPKGHEVEKPVVEVRVLASGDTCNDAESKARAVLSELKRLLEARDGVVVEEVEGQDA